MLKRLLPRSLFIRFLLIILVPTILVQVVTIYTFYNRHWDSVSRHMHKSFVGEIRYIVDKEKFNNKYNRDLFFYDINQHLYLNVSILPNRKIDLNVKNQPSEIVDLSEKLKEKIQRYFVINYNHDKSEVVVDIQFEDYVLRINSTSKRVDNPSNYIFIMWMTGTSLLLFFVSIIFMKNQIRPIKKLAMVAEQFGKGIVPKGYKPSGAYEVRKASQAFLRMTSRINRQVEQRTEMLAGVSHDLKTPLTRIKLQIALMEHSKITDDLEADVTLMQSMIQEYLDFTKAQQSEPAIEVNISEKFSKIIKRYQKYNKNLEYINNDNNIILATNVTSFKRAISNVIDNALKYGNTVKVSMHRNKDKLIITVEDNGIGIEEDHRELVFKPFYRVDQSRGLDQGGTGLGLSIAKDFVVSYGGSIKLSDSSLGGLKVNISFDL